MKTRHTAEQIVAKLREAEVELAKGRKVPEVVRKLGITDCNGDGRGGTGRDDGRQGTPRRVGWQLTRGQRLRSSQRTRGGRGRAGRRSDNQARSEEQTCR